MNKETFAAVATLATAMFVSQGTTAQDEPARTGGAAAGQSDRQSQIDRQAGQSDSSAQQAGQRAGQAGTARAGQTQNKDQRFVEFASTNDQFEIQAAKLAERQAQDDQIKQMARQVAQDHQEASQQLQRAAQQAGVQVSQQLKPYQQAMLQELQQMQGEDFDKAWLYGQVAGHTKAVLKFRDAAQELQNPQLKQFAQQTLPKLQQHLQHAQQMAQFDTAQTAGATERASDRAPGRSGTSPDRSGISPDRTSPDRTSPDRSGISPDRSGSTTPGSRSDTSGTDTQNRRGAGTSDSGAGAGTDAGSGGRSPPR